MVFTLRSSTSAPLLCSALAMADSSTLRSSLAARLVLNSSTFRASPTLLPRIWSATRRAFCEAMRAYLCFAATCICLSSGLHFGFGGLTLAVALENARGRELAQLVPDHVLADQHWHVLPAVVHRDGETHHLGRDHRAPRPGLDGALVVARHRRRDLLGQVRIDERAFADRTWHGITLSSLCVAAAHDHAVGALVAARLVTLGGLAPWGHRVPAAGGLALAAAVRMVDGIHDHAAHRGADALPAAGAGLAVLAQVVLVEPDLADGGAAVHVHLAHLAGAQAQRAVGALAGHHLHRRAGAAGQLRALAGLQLHAVHLGAHGDVAQRQRVARLDGGVAAGDDLLARFHALGGDDVAALAVLVQHQRDVSGAVRVVLHALDTADDAVLVALEVDHPVMLLVTAALVAGRDPAHVVAAAAGALALHERAMRAALVQARCDHLDEGPASGRGRSGFDEWHIY